MVALVPSSLAHVLDAVVDAWLGDVTAARREIAMVRAATAAERRDLEVRIGELDRQLAEADDAIRGAGLDTERGAAHAIRSLHGELLKQLGEGQRLRGELAAVPKQADQRGPLVSSGSGATTSSEEEKPEPAGHDLAHPLKPPGVPLGPPNNPRLSGFTTLVGLTFGTWLVLERGASGGAGATYWKCRCTKCGATKELAAVGAYSLRRKPPACAACRSKGKAKPPVEERDDEAEGDDQEGEE